MRAALLLPACLAAAVAGAEEDIGLMAPGAGAWETLAACTPCHSERIVIQQGLRRGQWEEVLDEMVEEHEMEPMEESPREVILDYLAEHYGPERPNFPRR